MQKLMNIGDYDSQTYGHITIKASLVQGGVSLYVHAGPKRNDILSRSFTDRAQAAVWYRHIRDAALVGKPVHQIEDEIVALVNAALATECADPRTADAEPRIARLQQLLPHEDVTEVKAAINADWDARDRQSLAAREQLEADVVAIMATSSGFRGDRTSTAAPTSDPMDRIISDAAHADGRIVRSKDATSTQLIALDKRGLVALVYGKRGNTRVITGARLTAKGFKHAGVEQKAVTA